MYCVCEKKGREEGVYLSVSECCEREKRRKERERERVGGE